MKHILQTMLQDWEKLANCLPENIITNIKNI